VLLARLRLVSSVKELLCPHTDGSGPLRLFALTSSDCRPGRLAFSPQESGRGPVSWLLLRAKVLRLVKTPAQAHQEVASFIHGSCTGSIVKGTTCCLQSVSVTTSHSLMCCNRVAKENSLSYRGKSVPAAPHEEGSWPVKRFVSRLS